MSLVIKKLVTAFILPPGVFIPLIICVGFFQFRKKDRLWIATVLVACLIYIISIPIVANSLMSSVEYHAGDQSMFLRADCIVVLGGGVVEGVRDLSGVSIPSQEASVRLLDAARIYRLYRKPVIVSGGSVNGSEQEAFILGRFLADLGVPVSQVITEGRARDTEENALFVKEICARKGYRNIILVTSSFHARRAERIFEKNGFIVSIYPSGQLSESVNGSFLDYVPTASAVRLSSLALKEMLGNIMVF
jgi:uncharacterized SAM-binding protein YcdF (DUF218 family)